MKLKIISMWVFMLLSIPLIQAQVDQDDEIGEDEPMVEAEEAEDEDEVFLIFQVQEMAKFKGGEKAMWQFLKDSLEYPEEAIKDSVDCRVTVEFVVEKDGSLSNLGTRGKGICGYGMEQAAVDAVKKMSGHWIPASQRGRPVRMKLVLPVRFKPET